MASIEDLWATPEKKEKNKNRKRYKVRWTTPDRNPHAKSFDKSGDAKAFKKQIEHDEVDGIYIDRTNAITVTQAARKHLETRTYAPATIRVARTVIRRIEKHPLGARPVARVTHSEAQAWVTGLVRDGLKPNTVRGYTDIMKTVFNGAIRDHIIRESPFRDVDVPPVDNSDARDVLTPQQVGAIVNAIDPQYRFAVIVQAGTGLRPAELLGLRYSDIDWDAQTIRVEGQRTQYEGYVPRLKNPTSRRVVPLSDKVTKALHAHITAYPNPGQFVFPWKCRRYWKVFARAVATAGLPKGIHPHDLRHHQISVALDHGVPGLAVARQAGHANMRQLRRYGHEMPGVDDRLRRAIDDGWEGSL